MFATPIPQLGQSFFTAASTVIAIPTGVQIFCWIATIWAGKPRFTTPLLFVIGFIITFVIGGLTGVMIASVPFDLQAHDTYFIVAHLHYVLIGGGLFPLFGAFYYWYPKMTGRLMSERMGKWNFWLFFTGVNVTFFPMHVLGLEGMTRRIYTYLPETGWGPLNLVSSLGAIVIVVSVVLFVANALISWKRGVPAGDNPWGAASLEWATESPPPPYVFLHVPVCTSEHPLWEEGETRPVVTGLRTDIRENLMTTLMDAEPDHRHDSPEPTIWPFVAALATGVMFITAIFTVWGLVIGLLLLFPPLLLWGWPRKEEQRRRLAGERDPLARAGS
jgi:cytochrome c oxidase subunit 1